MATPDRDRPLTLAEEVLLLAWDPAKAGTVLTGRERREHRRRIEDLGRRAGPVATALRSVIRGMQAAAGVAATTAVVAGS